MVNNLFFRSYRDGDEDRIFELGKAVNPNQQFDKEKWLIRWRWKFKENPAGNGWIWLAEDQGKIIGHSALTPAFMKVDTSIVRSFQSVDSMTHPEYRGRGIYQNLAKRLYSEAAKDGALLGYGFFNENSHLVSSKKLGWIDIPKYHLMTKIFNWRNALRPKIRNKTLRSFLAFGGALVYNKSFLTTQKPSSKEDSRIRQIHSFDDSANKLWNSVMSQYKITIVKNKDYLNWRYRAPGANYIILAAEKEGEMEGYLISVYKMREGSKECYIVDIIAKSEKVVHYLLLNLSERCKRDNVDIISYSIIANNAYQRVLRRTGFIFPPFIKGIYFSTYTSSTSISKEFLINPQNWFVQMGDSDVF
jgi:hypothetical protein